MNAIEQKQAFLKQLPVSYSTKVHYTTALNSKFLREHVQNKYGVAGIFDITDLEVLRAIYDYINLHPKNIAQHRNISCALMRYIRFLNDGKKYRPLISKQ